MQFAAFAEHARATDDEPGDTATRDLVAALLLASGEDLPVVARFVQGRVFPAWTSTTLDIGPSLCYAAEVVARRPARAGVLRRRRG
jgi:DNA ligase-1